MNTKLLVNGKLVKGKGDEQDVLNPATGKVIAQVAEASEEQITAAVSAAPKAFPGWAATVPKDRATLLMKLADRIEAEAHGVRGARIAELRQAAGRRAERRDPGHRRRVPLLRRRRRAACTARWPANTCPASPA